MEDDVHALSLPVPETVLRELAKNVTKALPNFAEKDPVNSVK